MNELTTKPPKISAKQKRFCKEYVIDHNQTQAAIRAGYSEKSATNNAHRLMVIEGIASHIEELETKIASELGITHHYVLSKTKKALEQAEKDSSQAAAPHSILPKAAEGN